MFFCVWSWVGFETVAVSRSSDPFSLFFGVTRSFVAVWVEKVYQVLIITGSLACALALHNSASRYTYAVGREVPSQGVRSTFAATHGSQGSIGRTVLEEAHERE